MKAKKSAPTLVYPVKWSYSSYKMWVSCGYKYFVGKVLRLPDPSGPAADRGTLIHAKAEGLLKGSVTGMPKELAKFSREFKELKKLKAKAELEWAFDDKWVPVAWSAKEAWVRGKLDAHILETEVLTSIDYKTGRIYPDHHQQGEIYNLMGFSVYPKIDAAHSEFWYLDEGSLGASPFSLLKHNVKTTRDKWTERGVRMMADRKFEPKPSRDACKYCNFKTNKGGPCNEWRTVL